MQRFTKPINDPPSDEDLDRRADYRESRGRERQIEREMGYENEKYPKEQNETK